MTLEQLSDQAELQRLAVDYAYAIDERQFDQLDQVFTPDAYIDYRAMGGIDGPYLKVKAWLPEALKHFPGYQHFIGNCRFDVTGDTATGKIACFNPMVIPDPQGSAPTTIFLGLWYIDRYVRTAQGWRIAERSEIKSYDHNVPGWMQKLMAQR